ncbi:hypothetical protein [Rhizobium leguminosarum]|uniref:hypothetical protein n=1 Tax=Rhizobium TaxID=379 RepID=UPI00140F6F51|nr:hypothetical protein [Rhizobium leguminosarum]QIO69660.1 hypothetical protein HA462_31960 [Rhizobium leguminosarum bv. trifolii]
MTPSRHDGRWLRWLVVDHLLLIVLILMTVTLFSIPLYKSINDMDQGNAPLERSTHEGL